MKRILYLIYPILLGMATVMAFAPWYWFVLAMALPALLERRFLQIDAKHAASQGFLFGIGFYGLGVSWVFFSIHDYSEAHIIVGLIITTALIIALSAFIALIGYVYRRLWPTPTICTRLLVFPSLWVLCEALRTWFLTGFPWLFLGYGLLGTPLDGFGPIIGVYGLSWVSLFIGMLVIRAAFGTTHQCLLYGFATIPIFIIGFALQHINWTKPDGTVYEVALVQGNIEQDLKWEPEKFKENFTRYLNLTEGVQNADIIVWPEAALPVPLPYGQPYLEFLETSIRPQSTVVLGAITTTDSDMFHNTVQVVGNGHGEYQKHHLVPFGEYVPFYKWIGETLDLLQLPMSFTVPGPRTQAPLQVQGWQMGALICYEVVYPGLALARAKDTDILLTISNDTWFGRSLGPLQHFQMSQMRALETGRYLIRATNNGVSGIINQKGQVMAIAPQYLSTTLVGSAKGMQGKTPLMFISHFSVLGLIFLILIINYGCNLRKKTL